MNRFFDLKHKFENSFRSQDIYIFVFYASANFKICDVIIDITAH